MFHEFDEDSGEPKTVGWIQETYYAGYKRVQDVSTQVLLLLKAWNVRASNSGLDWGKTKESCLELGSGFHWFIQQRASKETHLSVEERNKSSVQRGMEVFSTRREFENLFREVRSAVQMIETISRKGGSSPGQLGELISTDLTAKLVECRYVARLYLSILDLYNSLKELMFRHPAETAAPHFPDKFLFLRKLFNNNQKLLESFHQLSLEKNDHKQAYLKDSEVEFFLQIIRNRLTVLP